MSITIRPYVRGQDDAVRVDVSNRSSARDSDFIPLSIEDVLRRDKSPHEYKRHRFIAEFDGVPAGLGVAHADPEWPEKKGFMEGPDVVPEQRRKGVGTALARAIMDDLRQRGMEQVETTGVDREETNAFCAALGFKVIRSYSEMQRALDNLPTRPAESSRVQLETVKPNDDNLTTLVGIMNEAFKEYYEYRPWTVEYVKFLVTSEIERGNPQYFLFARIARAPVGYFWYGYNPKENAHLGRKSGFLWELAVLRPHRNQGIAKALMIAGLAHLKSDGMEEARLYCDDLNQTGAKQLYECLNFRIVHRDLAHQRDL